MQATRTQRATTNVPKERTFRSGPYLEKLFGPGGKVDEYLQRQICERIQQARHAAGFTQEDIASLLNITPRAYQNYESVRVPWRRLAEIAKLTGVPQEWLLRGDPPDVPAPTALLQATADGVAELSRSQESVHERLDEILERLARIEGWLSRPGAVQS